MAISVAVEYIETHRKDSSDVEIARALREQGFSDAMLAAAFRAAGDRPASAPRPKPPLAKRALVAVLWAVSALLFIGSALLFVRNFRQASAAAEAAAPR
jgi:hypothetical protein